MAAPDVSSEATVGRVASWALRRTRRVGVAAAVRSLNSLFATLTARSGCIMPPRHNQCLHYDRYYITPYAILKVMPKPAPDALALIEDFVNTVDEETGEEALGTPAELGAWLVEHELADAPAFDHDDLAGAIALRENLRALLLANNGAELDPAVPAALSAAADRARLTVAIDATGRASVTPRAGGIDRVAGQLLGIVARAQI